MSNNLKKIIIFLFIGIFTTLIIIKYSMSMIKNEIIDILKSPKFDSFIVAIFDQKLQQLADKDLSEEKKIFYRNNFKKIIKKFEAD